MTTMLSISDWAAQELARLLPQAEAIIPKTDNVHDANVRRRLKLMARYIRNKNAEKERK